jgi:hypothetical protein
MATGMDLHQKQRLDAILSNSAPATFVKMTLISPPIT